MLFIINETDIFAFTWHSDFPIYNPKRDNVRFTATLSLGIDLQRHTKLNYPFVGSIAGYRQIGKNKNYCSRGNDDLV